ncbi:MAG: STAS domain-containing protein [Acidobacteriota bacterium]|jgi:anti-anti-sigma regulatory factor
MTGTTCSTTVTVAFPADDREELTELVRGNEQRLLEEIKPLVSRQCVTLDLGPVRRIDAAGISALISLYRFAEEAGHCFTVSNTAPHVAEILSLVGLDRILLSRNAAEAPREPALSLTAA